MNFINFYGKIYPDILLTLQNKHQELEKEKQAIKFLRSRKIKEAEDIYRILISKGSKNHIVFGNLAAIYLMKGDSKQSIILLKKSLKIKPDYLEAYYNLGKAFNEKGDYDSAVDSFQKAIKIKPDYAEAHNNLGVTYQKKGNLRAAIFSFREAIKINNKNPKAFINLGNSLNEQGLLNEAIICFQKALALKPDYAASHNNLGLTYLKKGELKNAISCFKKAIKIKPDYAEAYFNLGISHSEKGDFDSAILFFHNTLKFKQNYPEALNNLGNCLKEKGELNNAISSFQKAIKIQFDYTEAHKNLGNALLLNGQYKKGLQEYEYRFKESQETVNPHIKPMLPIWKGESLNLNEKLLVVSEQGLGDTIQFMRYIPILKKKGFDVSFCAQNKLKNLIRSSGIDSNPLNPEQGKDIKKGRWIPLLSVPRLLDVTPNNPIVSTPYIHCSEELSKKWEEKLSTEEKPIIGINWQGDPNTEKNNLTGRSIPLELFSKIAEKNDCKFLSLQKGFGSEQLETCSFKNKFVKCQEEVNEIWEFVETAAIIYNTDLVITTDTSVAHLAAGMGKVTWCLIKYIPDWRWGMYDEKTFWYPSMKLFRQLSANNWEDVLKRVSLELELFLFKRNSN